MRRLILLTVGFVLLCGNKLNAQPFAPRVPQLPEGRALGLTTQIEELLQRMLAQYRDAETYQDQGRVRMYQQTGRILQTTSMPSSILMRRPNLIQMVGGGQLVSCDGKTLQIVLDSMGQYTSSQAPSKLSVRHIEIAAMGGGLDEGYPEITEFLYGEDVYPRWIRRIQRIDLADTPRDVDGRSCQLVRLQTVYQARIDLYIDAETHLLLRCAIDLTRAQDPANAPQRPPGQEPPLLTISYDLHPAKINAAIADEKFAVAKPDRVKLVSQFQQAGLDESPDAARQFAPDPGELVAPLVGKPVPKIQGMSPDDKPFSHQELSGRVTLLFLWSPNGGLDCLRAIQMVQRLEDGFKDEPKVSVLGLSGEGDNPDAIIALLKAKKATFRNLIDDGNLTMRAFNVQGLPLFFIISGDGTIKQAWYGAPFEREKQIADKIKEEVATLSNH